MDGIAAGKSRDQVNSPNVGPRHVIYEDQYQQLYEVTADFGHFSKHYVVRDSGQRAGLVVEHQGSILLVRQYRLIIDGLSWEIPGGRVDAGETPEEAAVRECLEETGIRCLNLRPLLYFHPGLDTFYNPTSVFQTEDYVETNGNRGDPREVVECTWVPLKQCMDMVFGGQIVDSLSIIALLARQRLSVE